MYSASNVRGSTAALLAGRSGAVSSGVLLGLSYPPFPFPYLAWFAFVPLLLGWQKHTDGRRAFLDAYLALLATFGIAFHWPLFHELPATALLSLPPLLVLPMWMALPFGLAHFLYRRRGMAAGVSGWIVLILLAEYGMRAGPLAFPWTLVGHTQAPVAAVNGLAALGGVPLLTLVVLLANAALFLALHRSVRAAIVPALLCLMLVAAPTIYDTVRQEEDRSHSHARVDRRHGYTRVAGVQPSVSPGEWADLDDSRRVTLLLDLSRRAATSDSTIDLIVWPETAIPPRPATRPYINRMQSLVDSTGIPILAGAITTGDGDSAYRNSAVLAMPGLPVRTYDKVNLVPFAEHVPFAGTIPFLERFAVPAGGVSGYQPGENRRIFEIRGLRFGVLICFETLFDDAARNYRREGAEMLVAVTQDGWWGDSFGYRQHLVFNRLRSIETGLPMIQSAVTGISALIHPDGRVEQTAGWMERTVWTVDVPPPAGPPPYLRLGDWLTVLAAIAAGTALALFAMRSRLLQRKIRRRHAT